VKARFWLQNGVLFSCKITHSILTSLERRGEDLSVFYEKCDWPPEFLRDSSSWLEAEKMELLLQMVDREYGRNSTNPASDEPLIVSVGHHCKELRSWGVLDSVLRMVQTPKDLFSQPERLVSYFISPAPPIGELIRANDSVGFVLPVSEVQFPFVTSYLCAAFEALPTYINKPMASVRWENSRVAISWSENQTSLFNETQNAELSLHPELVRSIVMNLESSQKELEETKKALHSKERELLELRAIQALPKNNIQPSAAAKEEPKVADFLEGLQRELLAPVAFVLNDLYRVGDYVARAQQLVTLLIGQGRATPQVQEAMRRVDWTFVAEETPRVIRHSVSALQLFQETLNDLQLLNSDRSIPEMTPEQVGLDDVAAKQPGDLNRLVGRAIDRVSPRAHRIQIHRELMLDRPVQMNEAQLERAVTSVLTEAIEASASGAVIRVSTKLSNHAKGARAHLEITEGAGVEELSLFANNASSNGKVRGKSAQQKSFPLAAQIVDLHAGSLTFARELGRGLTILIDLPLTN
jgi:signal transduction histidine kinase